MKYALALLFLAAPLQAQVMRQTSPNGVTLSSATGTFVLKAGDTMTGNLTVPLVTMTGSGGNAYIGTGDGELTAAGITINMRINRTGAGAVDMRLRSLSDVADIATATSDPITISPNGAETVRFAVDGSVGIGSVSPASKLHMSSGTFTIDGTSPGISVGTVTISGTAPPNGQALCLTAGRLGYCTGLVGATGGCTCAAP